MTIVFTISLLSSTTEALSFVSSNPRDHKRISRLKPRTKLERRQLIGQKSIITCEPGHKGPLTGKNKVFKMKTIL